MKRRRYLSALLAASLAALLSACGSSSTSTTVTVFPPQSAVILGGTQQFSATVAGPSDTTVSWSVGGSGCSGTACGTIDANGLYTAPSQMISPNTLTITATSNANSKATGTAAVTLDSGVRVQLSPTAATVGTSEKMNFTATVSGTTNNQVTWTVNGTPNGDSTDGQICEVGSSPCQAPSSPVDTVTYLAPANVVGTIQVTLAAVSVADTTEQATAKVTVMQAELPHIDSISPSATAQGADMQDVYVNSTPGYNFFSTSTVLANGVPVPTTFISTALLRARVPAAPLQSGQAVRISVEEQNGQTSSYIYLSVTPVRPSIVSFSPVSVPQCSSATCGSASVTLDGGYFSPSTVVNLNGQTTGATLKSTNQMAVSIPGSTLQNAGLYELTLTNPAAAQPEAAVNVAVEPNPAVNKPSVLAPALTVGSQPSAVAIDSTTGTAVVANSGDGTISLIDLTNCSSGSCPVLATVGVGSDPTGVAVDPLHHQAIVVNQGSDTLSVVNLNTYTLQTTIDLPANYLPVSIGENPFTQHALVANQETNIVTVVDLSQPTATVTTVDVTQGGTRSGGTGLNPRVTIEPRLDWAIVTPGGAGAISAIDMSHKIISPVTAQPTFNVVFSFALSTSVTGAALNPNTDDLLLTDPNAGTATIFSLLNESVRSVTSPSNTTVGFGLVASAVNPLTNVGLLVDGQTQSVELVDMEGGEVTGSSVPVGSGPVAAAIDPATDEAIVVNNGGSSVTVLSLGAVRSLVVAQASVSRLPASGAAQQITLIGGGFSSTATVRIDGTALSSSDVTWVSARVFTVTIPASYLSGPRILNLDVQNPDGTISNVFQIPVVQTVPVGIAPVGVAIDPASNTAIVTNSGAATASLIDLSAGAVSATVDVGSDPLGVAVFSRAGEAVVANSGDDTVSLVDLCTAASGSSSSSSCVPSATSFPVASTTGTVQQPVAVAVDSDLGLVATANQQSDTVSFLNALTGTFDSQLAVDLGPIGVAIDPNIGYIAALCGTQSPPTIDIADYALGATPPSAVLTGHITGANLPTGIALDPVNDLFLVADSTGNRILVVDPQSNKVTQNIGTGINPTSIAYNFNALEAVTVNTQSHTASVIEVTPSAGQVRALLLADGSSQQSVAINPLTNLAVVADQTHNQVLLVPLGH